MLQFANISRPGIASENAVGFGGERDGCHAVVIGAVDEVPGENHDVSRSFPQGWQADADDIEAVEEVGAEASGAGFLREIAIGGGDNSGAGSLLTGLADAAESAGLENAQ